MCYATAARWIRMRPMMHVLIVEDDDATRLLLHQWVESEGGMSIGARSAEQALALIDAAAPPDVALCDLRLPGKDGLWLTEQLRVRHPDTAVVIETGVHEFEAAVTSLHAGAVDYLVKPFTLEQLSEALNRGFFAHKSRCALAEMQHEIERRRAQITEALAEVEATALSSVNAMVALLQARDPGAYEHSHRVTRLAVNLALTLGIREPALSDIERAALLHDLGKLTLSDDLLGRVSEPLSARDRALVHAYPLHGYTIVKSVPFLAEASEIAVATHERYDGSGFPHGLRGEAIPLGARVVGVADAYDGLVAGIEHSPMTPERAVEILCTTRRCEFDARVLNALTLLHGRESIVWAPTEGPDAERPFGRTQ